MSSPGFILQSGFWSFVGAGPVPVVLAVDRSDSISGAINLEWSGNEPPYAIYIAADCSAVLDYFFAGSSGNSMEDLTPPAAALVCVNVQSMTSQTGPGFFESSGELP